MCPACGGVDGTWVIWIHVGVVMVYLYDSYFANNTYCNTYLLDVLMLCFHLLRFFHTLVLPVRGLAAMFGRVASGEMARKTVFVGVG